MKKTINLYLILLGVFVFSSCENATDIEQVGFIREDNVFENLNDLELGLSGAYSAYSTQSAIEFNAVFTDNTKRGADNLGQNLQLFQFTLNSNSAFPTSLWGNRYAAINRANRVIEGADELEFDVDGEQRRANNIKGQMIALRALAHLDLLQYFTVDYSDPNSLAVPYIDFIPEVNIQADRNTVNEVFTGIYNDLDEAQTLLSGTGDGSDPFYINQSTVSAIRARAALFQGNYELAEQEAQNILDSYTLATPEQYVNIFSDTGFQEVVFSLARGQGDAGIAGLFYFNGVSLSGGPIMEVSNELYNALDEDDVRFDVIVGPDSDIEGTNSENNIILINKYPGNAPEALVNDIKVFRASEMLLIKAETQARDGRLTEAAQSIKQLRDARFGSNQPLPSYGTLNDALNDILSERRKELAFEGHRFLDIKRLGQELNTGITRIQVDCTSFSPDSPCGLPRSDYRFTLPIPLTEVNANPNITPNPGY